MTELTTKDGRKIKLENNYDDLSITVEEEGVYFITADDILSMAKRGAALSEDDMFKLFDSGVFNKVLAGYLIKAMIYSGFKREDVLKAERRLFEVLDYTSAKAAKKKFEIFIQGEPLWTMKQKSI